MNDNGYSRAPEDFYLETAAAFVRGLVSRGIAVDLSEHLLRAPLEDLTEKELALILEAGREAGVQLKKFKRDYALLPRIHRSLGFLRAVAPESLLDVGSGRGAFLWSCLDAFPWLPVTTLEFSPHRIELYDTVRQNGVSRLTPVCGDVQKLDPNLFGGQTFDVVTIFEVLEHLPDPTAAIRCLLPLTRRYLILSVPATPDDNPEHIHLFNEASLRDIFRECGISSIRFDYVPNHLFAFITVRQ